MFWINLPICALAILLTAIFVPESKSATMRDVDPIGQALGMAFLFGVVFVLIEGPGMGWADARIIAVGVVALLAFVAFLRYESRRRDPFIDLRFFRSIPFASATMIAVCAFAAWGAFLFMMSLYLQGERGFSAMHTGLIYLPVAVGALIFSPLSGRLVGRFGSRPSLLIAGTLITAATLMLTRLTATTAGVAAAGDLRRVRHRLLDGERTDHQRGGQRHADRPGRRRLGGGLDQPAGGRESRCGAVRFGRRCGAGDDGVGLRGRGQAAVVGLRGTRRRDLRARPLLDVGAGDCARPSGSRR